MNTTESDTPLAEYPALLTVAELKQILRIGLRQAYALCKKPEFPAVKIGQSIRIPKQEFLAWLEAETRQSKYKNPFQRQAA